MIRVIFVTLLQLLIYNLSFSQLKIIEEQYKLPLLADRGYRSAFSYIDLKSGEYLRGVTTKSSCYIDVYDLADSKLKQTITLDEVSVLDNFVRTEDGNFWVLDDRTRTLLLYNDEGKVLDKIEEIKGGDVAGPYTSYYADLYFNPMVLYNDNLYWVTSFLSVSGKESDLSLLKGQGMIRKFDISQRKFSWEGQIPELLQQYDYGYLNRFSAVRKNDLLIVAPFYSNEIMVFGLQEENYVYPIVSKDKFFAIAEPFSELKKNPVSLKHGKGAVDHYNSNPHYIGILYDKERKIFYRIMQRKVQGFNKKEITVVILDEKFNYISDHKISNSYVATGMFVTDKGLNILNHKKYTENSSELVFDTFVF